jgi:peptidylprolyl isomerase
MRRRGIAAFLAAAVLALAPAAVTAQVPDWRTVEADNVLILDTSLGQVVVELAPGAAPQTAAHIRALVRSGFYDGSLFYRVLPGVLAQTGDRGTWRYASGQPNVPDEFVFPPGLVPPPPAPTGDPAPLAPRFVGSLPVAPAQSSRPGQAWAAFCPGVAGMAHVEAANSGESQIFFMLARAQNLEAAYTAWGRVVIGQDVLGRLAVGAPPPTPDRIVTARLAADIPEAQRPVLEVANPEGPAVARQVRDHQRRNGLPPGPCDVTLQARLRQPGG